MHRKNPTARLEQLPDLQNYFIQSNEIKVIRLVQHTFAWKSLNKSNLWCRLVLSLENAFIKPLKLELVDQLKTKNCHGFVIFTRVKYMLNQQGMSLEHVNVRRQDTYRGG